MWENRSRMDPSRKRAIRLTVALTAAVLLASALVFVSFASGAQEVTASQLLQDAKARALLRPGGKRRLQLGQPRGDGAAVPDP